MIRHNIIFKVKNNISPEAVDEAIAEMRSHQERLSGVFSIIGGECHFHDDKSMNFFMHEVFKGASHCISIDFTGRNELDKFFNDPSLNAAKQMIVDITEGGYDGVSAFDIEIAESSS